jgi:maltooligosyltrehalose synthase
LSPDPSQHGLVGPGAAPQTSGDMPASQADVWQDTRLILSGPNQLTRWRNVFTGEILVATRRDDTFSLDCADLFAHFPIALLLNEPLAKKVSGTES